MSFSSWIYAARPKTLVASFLPIVCSIIIVPKSTQINFSIFIYTLLSALFIQIGTNYINDLYDFLKGADNKFRVGPKRMIQSGLISSYSMKKGILLSFFISFLFGIPLVIKGGWIIVCIGLSAFLFGYLYTATPFSLAYNGLADFFVLFYFGIVAVCGSYYLQTGEFNQIALLTGVSMGCLNLLLLIVNNIRDYDNDNRVNKKTLVVKFGLVFARIQAVLMFVISYICIYYIGCYLENMFILFYSLLNIPLSIIILYDLFYKKDLQLNKTLPKVSLYLIFHTMLLAAGFHL